MSNKIKDDFIQQLGRVEINEDSEKKRLFRIHQSWWRYAILQQEVSPIAGNRINSGDNTMVNFITDNSYKAFLFALSEKEKKQKSIDPLRDRTNLMASQTVCFNAFGELWSDHNLATLFLSAFFPNIKQTTSVEFEYRPEGYIDESGKPLDKSGVDVAFFFETKDNKKIFFGFEVKYTDPFSAVASKRPFYKDIYTNNRDRFLADYDKYFSIQTNELFRNECIASWLKNHKEVEEAYTGIFYPDNYTYMRDSGNSFSSMVSKRNGLNFISFTYEDYLALLQKQEISWAQREWLFLLWARYCGLQLSSGLHSK